MLYAKLLIVNFKWVHIVATLLVLLAMDLEMSNDIKSSTSYSFRLKLGLAF